MYIVTLYCKNKEYNARFRTEKEACDYARMFWHLSPCILDPAGKPVLANGVSCAVSPY